MATCRETTQYPDEAKARAAQAAFLQFFPPFAYDSGATVWQDTAKGVWHLDTYRAGAC